VGQDVVVAGGDVVVGAAGRGCGYPDQAASLVGQGEEVQAVTAVFAGVVPPVGLSGAALGRDEGAVDQDDLPAQPADLFQGAVQARSLRGEQGDQLVAPAADGGLGHVVAASHVGQALVVTQHGQNDHRDPSGRQGSPPGRRRVRPARPARPPADRELFFEFVQFRAPRGDPFPQLRIRHAPNRR
jgi:hypothetical protein